MLHEIQECFKHSLLNKEFEKDLLDAIVGDDLTPEERLSIYKNNVISTLRDSLRAKFPATSNCLTAKFFGSILLYYIKEHPPKVPSLAMFGCDFHEFIANFRATSDIKFLPDLVRFEWYLHKTCFAKREVAISAQDMINISPNDYENIVFTLRSDMSLLSSRFQIDLIWSKYTNDNNCISPSKQTYLVFFQKNYQTHYKGINEEEYNFLQAVREGKKLGEILEETYSSRAVEFQKILSQNIADGNFKGFSLN
jgi:Putative DNA-binding domain